MTELAKNLQFRHATIAVHHPSSQGLVERKNQAIMGAIRQLAEEKPLEWDLCIPYAMLAINSAYCASVQESPFFLYRHRDSDLSLQARTTPRTANRPQQTVVREQIERQRQVYEIIRERLLASADRQIRYKDKTARPVRVKIDDRVYIKLVKNKKGQSKLTARWVGPYRVLTQKSPSVFKLKHIGTGKIIETHVENMKVILENIAPLQEVPQARTPLQPLAEAAEQQLEAGHLPLPSQAHIEMTDRMSNDTANKTEKQNLSTPAHFPTIRKGRPRAATKQYRTLT